MEPTKHLNFRKKICGACCAGCLIKFNSLTIFYEGKLSDLEKRAVELEHTTKQFNSNAKQVKINAQKHFWEGNELKILVGAILFIFWCKLYF